MSNIDLTCYRCRRPINCSEEVYRCYDCKGAYHLYCLKEHCREARYFNRPKHDERLVQISDYARHLHPEEREALRRVLDEIDDNLESVSLDQIIAACEDHSLLS